MQAQVIDRSLASMGQSLNEIEVTRSVRQVLFGFQDNLVVVGPPGTGKVTMTLAEISRHGTPYLHVPCASYTADDFWDFKRLIMEEDDSTVILLDEANLLPPSLAELVYMLVDVDERKGIIAVVNGPRRGNSPHLCFTRIIENQVTLG